MTYVRLVNPGLSGVWNEKLYSVGLLLCKLLNLAPNLNTAELERGYNIILYIRILFLNSLKGIIMDGDVGEYWIVLIYFLYVRPKLVGCPTELLSI